MTTFMNIKEYTFMTLTKITDHIAKLTQSFNPIESMLFKILLYFSALFIKISSDFLDRFIS